MTGRPRRSPEPFRTDAAPGAPFHDESFQAGTSWTHGDEVQLRKWVESQPFHGEVERRVGSVDADHVPAEPADDGEIHELDDGTLSIPVFEEQIVVTRRTVVRERVLLRREVVAETVEVNEELRREEFELEARDGRPVDVRPARRASPFPGSSIDPHRKSG